MDVGNIHGIISVPQNSVVGLNNVMSSTTTQNMTFSVTNSNSLCNTNCGVVSPTLNVICHSLLEKQEN